MRLKLALGLVAGVLCFSNCGKPEPKVYPRRWFYLEPSLEQETQVAQTCSLLQAARASGFTGVVLDAGLDKLDLAGPEYRQRLQRIKACCDSLPLEIIPCIFSVGYGHSLLDHNRHLAAGAWVSHSLHVVNEGKGRLVSQPSVILENGGFERHEGHKFGGWWLQDRPGRVSFVDSAVTHQGRYSIRFQKLHKSYKGHGRVMQEVTVAPHRTYRITGWVKTENLLPEECFKILVLRRDRSELTPRKYRVPATTDWQPVEVEFNTFGQRQVRVYVGVWGATKGRLWLDDFKLKEVGLLNVLRRPGTPVTVKGLASGQVYEEGRDYAPIIDTVMDFEYGREPVPVTVLPEGRIQEGESLAVSYYHPIRVRYRQTPICMSEPEIYRIWEQQARLIHDQLGPKTYFLDMDEIRAGGECQACRERKQSMAQILGDCITRQCQIIRAVNPQAEVYIWSDMLDPYHNGIKGYYLVRGDFTGAWQYVPPDLGIMCWHYEIRKKSLRHFSRHGFKTMAATYYDHADLTQTRKWLEALDRTEGACGVMYATWNNTYDLLQPFGEMVSKREQRFENND